MPGGAVTAEERAVGVLVVVQALGEKAPLYRIAVAALRHGDRLVRPPTRRAVVQDEALRAVAANAVAFVLGTITAIAGAHPQVAYNDVMGVDQREGVGRSAEADPVAGCRLAGDGEIRLPDLERRPQRDRPTNAKDHRAGPLLPRSPRADCPRRRPRGWSRRAPGRPARRGRGAKPSAPGKARVPEPRGGAPRSICR